MGGGGDGRSLRGGERREDGNPGDSHAYGRTGMLVVSLRGVNLRVLVSFRSAIFLAIKK